MYLFSKPYANMYSVQYCCVLLSKLQEIDFIVLGCALRSVTSSTEANRRGSINKSPYAN